MNKIRLFIRSGCPTNCATKTQSSSGATSTGNCLRRQSAPELPEPSSRPHKPQKPRGWDPRKARARCAVSPEHRAARVRVHETVFGIRLSDHAREVPEAPRAAGAAGNRSGAYAVHEHRKPSALVRGLGRPRTMNRAQMPEISGGRDSEVSAGEHWFRCKDSNLDSGIQSPLSYP